MNGSERPPGEQHWDTVDIAEVRDVSWLSIQEVSEFYGRAFESHLDPRLITDPLLEPLTAERGLRGLALVCGDMAAEYSFFVPRGPIRFESVIGVDLSQASLDRAHEYARGFPFVARCEDANDLDLPPGSLDLAVGMHGIHHIERLPEVFDVLRRALSPGGVLYLYEWIGPEYLQIPRRNRLWARLCLLAFSRRERTTHTGRRKGWFLQGKAATFDPSEACNSTVLREHYTRTFASERELVFGGLLYPMFEGSARNIDMTRELTRRRVDALLRLERWLTERGWIEPLFMMAVGRPRP